MRKYSTCVVCVCVRVRVRVRVRVCLYEPGMRGCVNVCFALACMCACVVFYDSM